METADLTLNERVAWPENPAIDVVPKSFSDFVESVAPFIEQSIDVTNIVMEKESEEYGALRFNMGSKTCLFRQAKTTPKKVGQFVTIWKREHLGAEIAPFESGDNIDFVIVAVHDEKNQGYFIFDKETLIKKRVFTDGVKEGKRAIRVYPPWTMPTVKQAISTQKWQTAYLVKLDGQNETALQGVNALLK